MRSAKEFGLLGFANLPDELHSRCVKKRKNMSLKVILIGRIDLRGDAQWKAATACDLNCAIDTFLRCNAA